MSSNRLEVQRTFFLVDTIPTVTECAQTTCTTKKYLRLETDQSSSLHDISLPSCPQILAEPKILAKLAKVRKQAKTVKSAKNKLKENYLHRTQSLQNLKIKFNKRPNICESSNYCKINNTGAQDRVGTWVYKLHTRAKSNHQAAIFPESWGSVVILARVFNDWSCVAWSKPTMW